MANPNIQSNNFIDDMEFEEHMRTMSDRELIEFTARSVYDIGDKYKKHDKILCGNGKEGLCDRVTDLEKHIKNDRMLTMGIWGINVIVFSSLIGYVISKLG